MLIYSLKLAAMTVQLNTNKYSYFVILSSMLTGSDTASHFKIFFDNAGRLTLMQLKVLWSIYIQISSLATRLQVVQVRLSFST